MRNYIIKSVSNKLHLNLIRSIKPYTAIGTLLPVIKKRNFTWQAEKNSKEEDYTKAIINGAFTLIATGFATWIVTNAVTEKSDERNNKIQQKLAKNAQIEENLKEIRSYVIDHWAILDEILESLFLEVWNKQNILNSTNSDLPGLENYKNINLKLQNYKLISFMLNKRLELIENEVKDCFAEEDKINKINRIKSTFEIFKRRLEVAEGLNIAIIHYLSCNYEKAEKKIEDVINLPPEDLSSLSIADKEEYKNLNINKNIHVTLLNLKANIIRERALINSNIQKQLEAFKMVENIYKESLTYDDENLFKSHIYANEAFLQIRLDNLWQANEKAKDAYMISPNDPYILNVYAITLHKWAKHAHKNKKVSEVTKEIMCKQSLSLFNRAIVASANIKPNNDKGNNLSGITTAVLRKNRASIYKKMDKLNEALDDIEFANYIKPEDPQVLHEYGLILLKQGSYQDAADKFDKAFNIHWLRVEDEKHPSCIEYRQMRGIAKILYLCAAKKATLSYEDKQDLKLALYDLKEVHEWTNDVIKNKKLDVDGKSYQRIYIGDNFLNIPKLNEHMRRIHERIPLNSTSNIDDEMFVTFSNFVKEYKYFNKFISSRYNNPKTMLNSSARICLQRQYDKRISDNLKFQNLAACLEADLTHYANLATTLASINTSNESKTELSGLPATTTLSKNISI